MRSSQYNFRHSLLFFLTTLDGVNQTVKRPPYRGAISLLRDYTLSMNLNATVNILSFISFFASVASVAFTYAIARRLGLSFQYTALKRRLDTIEYDLQRISQIAAHEDYLATIFRERSLETLQRYVQLSI
jgi:hypothetical protein